MAQQINRELLSDKGRKSTSAFTSQKRNLKRTLSGERCYPVGNTFKKAERCLLAICNYCVEWYLGCAENVSAREKGSSSSQTVGDESA